MHSLPRSKLLSLCTQHEHSLTNQSRRCTCRVKHNGSQALTQSGGQFTDREVREVGKAMKQIPPVNMRVFSLVSKPRCC